MNDSDRYLEYSWNGMSSTRLVDGKLVPKKTDVWPFIAYTLASVLGLVLAVRHSAGSWPGSWATTSGAAT